VGAAHLTDCRFAAHARRHPVKRIITVDITFDHTLGLTQPLPRAICLASACHGPSEKGL
jgi:hypothetical protein